ncbi:MAG: methyltransferase domain-containing protein [Alphaproteobacteria bacterium]|nr:methyltransferase domain-containing protein [Alphaproteobacteria bacterium]
MKAPHQRFLGDRAVDYRGAIDAARAYVSKLSDGEADWLRYKPFDPTPGNPQYFRLMYDLLNILQAMAVPRNGRVLEIGGGPGWITEILVMLGHSVDVIEPAADLADIARARCDSLAAHYRRSAPPSVRFHGAPLEEADFPERSFDAILFFDVLHHVVDERAALSNCFRFLAPGGNLGIVEAAWRPDCPQMERALLDEMEKFGVVENPFTAQYLDQLLREFGFIDIQRFTGVNGFFGERDLDSPLRAFGPPLTSLNNLTARRPSIAEILYPDCTDLDHVTGVTLDLISGAIDQRARAASLVVRLTNTGRTRLSHRPSDVGQVTLALRRGEPGSPAFVECAERHPLIETLIPGHSLVMRIDYTLPAGVDLRDWQVDLVAEGAFWFSRRGIPALPIPLAPAAP